MNLSQEQMVEAMLKADRRFDGQFITGVLTTGIYCLPSCRAKKPKPENVRFFECGSEAKSFGLRACKKCKPDEFERGEDVELDSLEAVVSAMRSNPGSFSVVGDLASKLGVGQTKLNQLFRQHYQSSPGELLLRARFQYAKQQLLRTNDSIGNCALESGFESLSAFNEGFRKRFGLTPSDYRALPEKASFQFDIPPDFNLDSFQRSFSRDPLSPTERLVGNEGKLVLPSGHLVQFVLGSRLYVCAVPGTGVEAYETFHRVLGLSQDVSGFEAQAAELGFPNLIKERTGTRIPQTISLLDALIWVVVGQQVNLSFTFALRRRLFEKLGKSLGDGLYSVPTLESIAYLAPSDLTPLQFSNRKAEYLIGLAKQGRDWIETLETCSYTRARQILMDSRGIGVWSTQYLLMRGLGFPDCLPLGDTGLRSGVAQLFGLAEQPALAEIEAHMDSFSPHRSLATFHLWQSLK